MWSGTFCEFPLSATSKSTHVVLNPIQVVHCSLYSPAHLSMSRESELKGNLKNIQICQPGLRAQFAYNRRPRDVIYILKAMINSFLI